MDIYAQIIVKIIKEQEQIIGPVALDQAKHIKGLNIVNPDEVAVTGDGKKTLTELVSQYSKLFGKASIELCKDAIRELTPSVSADLLPDILK